MQLLRPHRAFLVIRAWERPHVQKEFMNFSSIFEAEGALECYADILKFAQ